MAPLPPSLNPASDLSAELRDLIQRLQQTGTDQQLTLEPALLQQAQQLRGEISEAYSQLLSGDVSLSDEQLESIAAGRLDVSSMVIALASALTISTGDGAALLGTSLGGAAYGGGLPTQAVEQVQVVVREEPWMAQALTIIKAFEGLELDAYVDAVGVTTIGWGTTLYNDGRPVQTGDRITADQADQLLRQQVLRDYAPGVFKALPLAKSFTPRQQAALISFTYNVGVEALNESTLRKRLLSGEDPARVIREELPRWRFGDEGQVLAGLERRRAAEINLFLS
jgi:GH24 family phage-related lysozyme (muramidase)